MLSKLIDEKLWVPNIGSKSYPLWLVIGILFRNKYFMALNVKKEIIFESCLNFYAPQNLIMIPIHGLQF